MQIEVSIPKHFRIIREMYFSKGGFKLINLYQYDVENGIDEQPIGSDRNLVNWPMSSRICYVSREVNSLSLEDESKFFWIKKDIHHKWVNPKPRPKSWWKGLFYEEDREWITSTLIGNIQFGDDTVHVNVYGEKMVGEVTLWINSIDSLKNVKVRVQLRQTRMSEILI